MCCFRIGTSLGWKKCHKNFPTSPKETQQLVCGNQPVFRLRLYFLGSIVRCISTLVSKHNDTLYAYLIMAWTPACQAFAQALAAESLLR